MGITGNYCPVFLVTEESGAHTYGPLDVHNCNMGVMKFNIELPYPGSTAIGGVATS